MKTNIGRDYGKKYRHNLSKTVYTTSQFGFCQPVFCRELASQDSIKLRTASKVFLEPVSKPTFGRLMIKQYKAFVPIEEIFHPFASLMSGKPYSGAGASYVPQSVPSLPLYLLTCLVQCCSEVSVFASTSENFDRVSFSEDDLTKTTISSNARNVFLSFLTKVFVSCGFQSGYADRLLTFLDTYGLYSFDLSDTPLEPARYDWFQVLPKSLSSYQNSYLICGRFSDRGKNLRKILLGLGYQLSGSTDSKTILPIFAYYKMWFDLFAIQREMTWKYTNAYSYLEYVEQFNFDFGIDEYVDRVQDFYEFFFLDLPACYYTQSPDYAAAHIGGTAIGEAQSRSVLTNGLSGGASVTSVEAYRNAQPILSLTGPITQQSLDVLRKLYHRVNKATAIGGRIKEFMRSIFGSAYDQDDETNFIGSDSYTIDITQVMSNAQTEEAYLGQYAGKGVGESGGDFYSFTARKAGFLLEIFAVVPDARLAQAVDPMLSHVRRADFYDPSFDSVTLLPSRKSSVYGVQDYILVGDSNLYGDGFGNIPNYMEYKVSFDTLNGDMSMPSTRASFLPFTLSKLLPYTTIVKDGSTVRLKNINPNIITQGDLWRYIGRDRWLGNFDRIFINESPEVQYVQNNLEGRVDDNFICFFYVDLGLSGFELPVADSYQTDSFGDHDTIEKA